MSAAGRRRCVCAALGALLIYLLFLHALGERPLASSHEARAAQNAQTMLSEGDWLMPRLYDRQVELQKPPLYYWLIAWCTYLRGSVTVTAWDVRLPAALAALLCVLGVYQLGKQQSRTAGCYAALVLATCWHFTWLGRVGRIDMPLTLCCLLALAVLARSSLTSRKFSGCPAGALASAPAGQPLNLPAHALAYSAIGVGVLLKGPIAAVLPATVVAAWLAYRRWQGEALPLLRSLWWGVPLVLLIAGPWYLLAVWLTRGDFWHVFFWYHNIARGFGGADELVEQPCWFYLVRCTFDLLPWSILLPLALCMRGRLRPLARFGLLWFASMLLLLSLLRFKRADYLLPAYPGFALCLGVCLAQWQERWPRLVRGGVALAVGGCVVAWWSTVTLVLPAREALQPEQRFAAAIRQHSPGTVLFFRVEDHDVAFHAGPPIETLLEWENLRGWVEQSPEPFCVVMRAEDAAQRDRYLPRGALGEVVRSADLTTAPPHRPLILLRSQPR